MAQKSWPWSTVAAIGDGSAQLSEALSREFLAVYFGVQNPALEGVSKGVGGELAVTGTASPLAVAAGSGICYGLYINDAATTTPAITTPAVGTTGFRVVLRTDWATATTRIAVRKSADGVAAIPALVQVFGTTWEVSLATGTITTGGVIAVTDARVFRRSTAVIGAGEIDSNAVGDTDLRDSAGVSVIGRSANSVGDPADIVAGADDRLLARTGGVVGFVQATIGMIPDALITLAKLVSLAGLSVLGRSANSTGVMGAITGTDGQVLRVSGTTLGFGTLVAAAYAALSVGTAALADLGVTTGKLAALAVTTAKLALNSVDDTIAGDRVPQFYRRQGGDATQWATQGSTNRTPTAVRMQAGVIRWTGAADLNNAASVTFPVAFSATPIVIATARSITGESVIVDVDNPSTTAVDLRWQIYAGAGHEVTVVDINWLAMGPE